MIEEDQQNEELTFYEPISPLAIPDLIEIVNSKYEAGKYWADALSIFNALERGLSIKLARIKQDIRKNQPPPEGKKAWTDESLDDEAKATKEYEDYIDDLNIAHNEMLKAINEKNTLESAFDAIRSMMANERELGKNLK